MNLNEAIKTLKNAGYLTEETIALSENDPIKIGKFTICWYRNQYDPKIDNYFPTHTLIKPRDVHNLAERCKNSGWHVMQKHEVNDIINSNDCKKFIDSIPVGIMDFIFDKRKNEYITKDPKNIIGRNQNGYIYGPWKEFYALDSEKVISVYYLRNKFTIESYSDAHVPVCLVKDYDDFDDIETNYAYSIFYNNSYETKVFNYADELIKKIKIFAQKNNIKIINISRSPSAYDSAGPNSSVINLYIRISKKYRDILNDFIINDQKTMGYWWIEFGRSGLFQTRK